ncbi:MAG: DNA polymerase delta, subunit 4-domain-containing protein [Benniella sp.]|nr:MAG: DNA polymerase delta, subunit 4-domain-containing protein [Benniella sp.]
MPPKRTTVKAASADAVPFFQRGKKPTTAQRVYTSKAPLETLTHPSTAATTTTSPGSRLQSPIQHVRKPRQRFASLKRPRPKDDKAGQDSKEEQDVIVIIDDEQDNKQDQGQNKDDDLDGLDEWILQDDVWISQEAQGDKPLFTVTTAPVPTVIVPTKERASTAPAVQSKVAIKVVPKVVPKMICRAIHQNGLSEDEKLLRQFDLASKYGPCLDLTRLERWERAFELGLDPPQNVKTLLLQHEALNAPLFAGTV